MSSEASSAHLCRVEGDDADRVVVLPGNQIGDDGFQIGVSRGRAGIASSGMLPS